MDLKKEYRKAIRKWVKKCYGQSEANNPSWNIKALAEAMAEEHMKLHEEIVRTDIAEAVKGIAEDNGIELTDKQIDVVADEYRYSEAYCEDDTDAVLYFINEELSKGE